MPWPNIFGRRCLRAAVQHLSEAVHDLQSTTNATAIELSEAVKQLQSANNTTAFELSEAVKQLQNTTNATAIELSEASMELQYTRPAIQLRTRSKAPALICVLAILIGSAITTTALNAFGDPIAFGYREFASADFVVEIAPSEIAEVPYQPYGASFIGYSQHDDWVEYSFLLPEEFAGRKFRLLLTGSAVLTNTTGGSTLFEDTTCPEPPNSWDDIRACQVIEGVLDSPTDTWFWPAGCTPTGGLPQRGINQLSGGEPSISLKVAGRVDNTLRLDWAHQELLLPNLGFGFTGTPPFSTWREVDLGGQFLQPNSHSCKLLEIPFSETVTDIEPSDETPKQDSRDYLVWDGAGASSMKTLVTRARFAGVAGNGLLALGAAVIAVGIGFIPVVYQQVMARRQYRVSNQRARLSKRRLDKIWPPLSDRQMQKRAKLKRELQAKWTPEQRRELVAFLGEDQDSTWSHVGEKLSAHTNDPDALSSQDRLSVARIDRAIRQYEARNHRQHHIYANVHLPPGYDVSKLEEHPAIHLDRWTAGAHNLHEISSGDEDMHVLEITTCRGMYFGQSGGGDDTAHLLPRGMSFTVTEVYPAPWKDKQGNSGHREVIRLQEIYTEQW